MTMQTKTIQATFGALVLMLLSTTALASNYSGQRGVPTILAKLVATDGAQALVAAVLVVDGAGALPFSLAELLGDKREEVVLLAPTNTAFENLLGLEPGTLDGLTIGEIEGALPALLPPGVGVDEVAAIRSGGDLRAILRRKNGLWCPHRVFPVPEPKARSAGEESHTT